VNEIRKYMNLVESKLFEDSKDDSAKWSKDAEGKAKIDSVEPKNTSSKVDIENLDTTALKTMLTGLHSAIIRQMWGEVQRGYKTWEISDDHAIDMRALFSASQLQDRITSTFYQTMMKTINDQKQVKALLDEFEKDAKGFVLFQQDIAKRVKAHTGLLSGVLANSGWGLQEDDMPDADTVYKMHHALPYDPKTTPSLDAVLDATQQVKQVVAHFWDKIFVPALATLKQSAPESYAFIEQYNLLPDLEKEIKRLSAYVGKSLDALERDAVKDLWKGSSNVRKH
jgi:hypothetical protein